MYSIMNVHPLTLMIITSSMMLTPFFILATYAFSGASLKKGFLIGSVFMILGGLMTWICLAGIPASLGSVGSLIVPICWLTPTVILFYFRSWFLDKPLSQHFLISLQLWRIIGVLFIFEMFRNNVPAIFALPAGVGDIAVAIIAAFVVIKYRNSKTVPNKAIVLVIISGIVDFLGAFFFGFTSSTGPMQIFFPEITNKTMQFPLGMIPLFLVAYAIFFHALSWFNFLRHQK